MILDTATINQLKENKSLITFELLEALRAKGNEGKQLCLDILDTKKDEEDYYLDAFGGRITFHSGSAFCISDKICSSIDFVQP